MPCRSIHVCVSCDINLSNCCSVMYSGINSLPPIDSKTPVGAAPYSTPPAAVYFIIYMIIITFVLLPLFIGVVIVTFQEVGVKSYRETKLDRNQVCICIAITIILIVVHDIKVPLQANCCSYVCSYEIDHFMFCILYRIYYCTLYLHANSLSIKISISYTISICAEKLLVLCSDC